MKFNKIIFKIVILLSCAIIHAQSFQDSPSEELDGDFPSKWDLIKGSGQIMTFEGEKVINLAHSAIITPLLDSKNYLSDNFTLEFEAYFDQLEQPIYYYQYYTIRFWSGSGNYVKQPTDGKDIITYEPLQIQRNGVRFIGHKSNSELAAHEIFNKNLEGTEASWKFIVINFNNGTLKVSIDGTPILNIPRLNYRPTMISIGNNYSLSDDGFTRGIKNVMLDGINTNLNNNTANTNTASTSNNDQTDTTLANTNIQTENYTYSLPINDGNSGQILQTDGNGKVIWVNVPIVESTSNTTETLSETSETILNSGLEAIDEGNGIGWRLKGRDPNHYGNIGINAVDLSFSNGASTTNGATGSHSTAFGYNTIATLGSSTAMGQFATASGFASTAMGESTIANGNVSFAAGYKSMAPGNIAIAAGNEAIASGDFTISLGDHSVASGNYSAAIGSESTTSGNYSTAIGHKNKTMNNYATAFGSGTLASGEYATSLGNNTVASAKHALAMGNRSEAIGIGSVAIGDHAKASNLNSFALGMNTEATGRVSTALGQKTKASGFNSTAFGILTIAQGDYSTATGNKTEALGESSFTSGSETKATKKYATAMEYLTEASGENATAIGHKTIASGIASIAMGSETIATGTGSIALGRKTAASGMGSTAMGFSTVALGEYSTAVGFETKADGKNATALGNNTQASGENSTALGLGTSASEPNSLVIGQYNNIKDFIDDEIIFQIGNGTGNDYRRDAFRIHKNGYTFLNGGINISRDITLFGELKQPSDERLKTDITGLNYGLSEILKLKPVSYYWKNKVNDHKSLGLIAQDVQFIIKEIVQVGNDNEKTLSLNYTELIPVLIKAIQEQQTIIENQNKKIDDLTAESNSKDNTLNELGLRIEQIELLLKNDKL